MKYEIERNERWELVEGELFFDVTDKETGKVYGVSYDGGKARCSGCQGPMSGMSMSCPHANAVKRYVNKNKLAA